MPRTDAFKTKYARADLTELIHNRMHRMGVTQSEMAKVLGTSRPNTNLIINGKGLLSFERFVEISDYLGFTTTDIKKILGIERSK